MARYGKLNIIPIKTNNLKIQNNRKYAVSSFVLAVCRWNSSDRPVRRSVHRTLHAAYTVSTLRCPSFSINQPVSPNNNNNHKKVKRKTNSTVAIVTNTTPACSSRCPGAPLLLPAPLRSHSLHVTRPHGPAPGQPLLVQLFGIAYGRGRRQRGHVARPQ